MDPFLIILTIITVILILGVTIGILKSDVLGVISAVFLGVIIICGWGVFASMPDYTKEIPVKCTSYHIKSEVLVYTEDGKKEFFDTKSDWDNITDTTNFYYLVYYDHYGSEKERKLKYK